jgi:UrcA family protein
MSRPLSFACASALLLAFASPAFAQDRNRQQVVEYGDVDQYSDRGADQILRRVQNASENVCGDQPGAMPVTQRDAIRDCTNQTMDQAVADIDNSIITARYYGVSPEVIVEEGSFDPYVDMKGSK